MDYRNRLGGHVPTWRLATVLTQRLAKQRKQIGWSVVSHSSLLASGALQDLTTGFGVPLEVRVAGRVVADLATVRMRIGNVGNTVVEKITLHFSFGEGATVYVGRYLGDLGVYQEKLRLAKQENTATLEIAHINPRQSFDLEFLVSGDSVGSAEVEVPQQACV